ncbi:3'-5' exonuclease [Marinobacter subterrani]|uniref:DNA polymerase III, epsilon subunit n=1 Tax=Marinobacter subterrani TaxID=1658765 RepID=A0A0J7J3K7_9GAMM|nr:3'-5' exonuclease [Marinobacter subterrani]KMQ73108.1 DNA polymerase III, epsilon subunit [Marinobacter subterrani]
MSDGANGEHSVTRLPWPEQYQALAGQSKSPLLKAFYQSGCVAPDTPLSEVPMVAVDFETTGLDANQHSIVSIGLVPFTLEGIQLSQAKHWIVRPKLPLHQTSITIHGITHSDIDKAPDLEEILGDLFACLKGRIPVVHYRDIERPFLDVALKWRLGEGIRFPVLDTMAIEAHLHPDRHPSRWQKLMGKKPVSIRLADSRLRYGLPHYAAHNALIDAIATAELLQAQVWHHFGPQTAVGDLWL